MNHEMNPDERRAEIEERAFDAWLAETVGGLEAPDLSAEILQRLPGESGCSPASDPSEPGRGSEPRRSPVAGAPELDSPRRPSSTPANSTSDNRGRVRVAIAVLASLAAAILIFLSLFREPPGPQVGPQEFAAGGGDAGAERSADGSRDIPGDRPAADGPDRSQLAEVPADRSEPPRGISLLKDHDSASDGGRAPAASAGLEPQRPARQREQIHLVSQRVSSDLEAYWRTIGVTPAEPKSADATATALRRRLGVELAPETLAGAEGIRVALAQPANAWAVARGWLRQITEGGLDALTPERRRMLVEPLAASVSGRLRFDSLLAYWLSVPGEPSTAWYTAMAHGGRSDLVRRTAALTMNVDLRCTRCHDAYIEGNGRQRDYWNFHALLRRKVGSDGGVWKLAADRRDIGETFFDLPDGRRQVAEPAVAEDWLDRPDATSLESVAAWAEHLLGSEQLATGVVNSLWELVYGRPLRGRVVDTVSAPYDDTLDQLEQRLAEDLIASGFDIGRTLSLIIASPATDRSVPESFLENGRFAADEQAVQAAWAFAAATQPRKRLGLGQRLDLVMRSVGGDLGQVDPGRSVLAQATGSGEESRAAGGVDGGVEAPSDYPIHAETLPVQWLGSIDDLDAQVEHLAYLSGQTAVPSRILEAARAMEEAGVKRELLLRRVWWLLRP